MDLIQFINYFYETNDIYYCIIFYNDKNTIDSIYNILKYKDYPICFIKYDNNFDISNIKKDYRMFICNIKYKNLIDFTDISTIITLKYKYIDVNHRNTLLKYFIYI